MDNGEERERRGQGGNTIGEHLGITAIIGGVRQYIN